MRNDNSYDVDKTRFIPLLEAQPYFVFLIRPRRFGKTLWLSLLQHYYDTNRQAQFDQLFGGAYIGDRPTPERNSYLVMFFNFALVNPAVEKVEASFEDSGRAEIESFLRHLLTADGHLNGNFSKLRSIIETGEVVSSVVSCFPLVRLAEPENFVSQLLFLGLLTFAGEEKSLALL